MRRICQIVNVLSERGHISEARFHKTQKRLLTLPVRHISQVWQRGVCKHIAFSMSRTSKLLVGTSLAPCYMSKSCKTTITTTATTTKNLPVFFKWLLTEWFRYQRYDICLIRVIVLVRIGLLFFFVCFVIWVYGSFQNVRQYLAGR